MIICLIYIYTNVCSLFSVFCDIELHQYADDANWIYFENKPYPLVFLLCTLLSVHVPDEGDSRNALLDICILKYCFLGNNNYKVNFKSKLHLESLDRHWKWLTDPPWPFIQDINAVNIFLASYVYNYNLYWKT